MSLCWAGEEGPTGSGLHRALFGTWHPPAASSSREEIATRTTLSLTEGHYLHTNARVGLEKVSSVRFTLPVTQIYQDLCQQQTALLSLVRLCGFWASSLTTLAGLQSVTIQVPGGSSQHCAVCSRPVQRHQIGPGYCSGKFVVFHGDSVVGSVCARWSSLCCCSVGRRERNSLTSRFAALSLVVFHEITVTSIKTSPGLGGKRRNGCCPAPVPGRKSGATQRPFSCSKVPL